MIDAFMQTNRITAEPDPVRAAHNLLPRSTRVSSVLMEDLVSGDALSIADGSNKVALFANPYR